MASFKDRLRALEEKVAREGIILTEAQVAALEKKQYDDEVAGEIDTAHPGYLGSQDTFYVGNLKGVEKWTPKFGQPYKWLLSSTLRCIRQRGFLIERLVRGHTKALVLTLRIVESEVVSDPGSRFCYRFVGP